MLARRQQRQAQESAMEVNRLQALGAQQEGTSPAATERSRAGNKRGLASGSAGRSRGLDSESGPSPSD
eukprot:6992236-Heterocapsa_arctica.AAC.1